MNRIKNIFSIVHIVLWILFSLLAALQLSQEYSYWPHLTAAVSLTALYVFYGHFLLLTRYLGRKKKRAYFIKLLGIMISGPVLYMLLHPRDLNTSDLLFEYYFISLFSIILPFIFLSWLARITENLVLNTIRKEQLEKQATQAELHYLKSQINPHFLFNTLNNIHTLAYKQAAAAPEAILRLSSLMRYMIYESNADTVALSREIDYLNDYISLQQLRYNNEHVVDFKISGPTESCSIAPLLFVDFLENAYKHSPARLEPGDIRVRIKVEGNTLIFNSENPIAPSRGNSIGEDSGIGLPNIRKRLQLLYPDAHSLKIVRNEGRYSLELKINDLHKHFHERKDHLLYNR